MDKQPEKVIGACAACGHPITMTITFGGLKNLFEIDDRIVKRLDETIQRRKDEQAELKEGSK